MNTDTNSRTHKNQSIAKLTAKRNRTENIRKREKYSAQILNLQGRPPLNHDISEEIAQILIIHLFQIC